MSWHRNEIFAGRGGRRGRRLALRPSGGRVLVIAVALVAASATAAAAATATGGAPVNGRIAAASSDSVTVTSHFGWRTTSDSLSGDSTLLNNGATNEKSNDLLFVTANLSPGGISPCPCLLEPTPPTGVWYNGSQWAIFNENGSAMGTLMSYNVLVVPKSGHAAFAVHATSASKHGDYLIINSPATNGNAAALIQITQVYNPSDVFNPHQVGVRYLKVRHRWAIFNEDGAAMPLHASFNVLVGDAPSNGGSSDNASIIAAYSGTKEAAVNWADPGPPVGTAFNLLIFSS